MPREWLRAARRKVAGAVRRTPLGRLHAGESVASYWSRHNVTLHHSFSTAEESLEYVRWRNDQYFGYIDLMPVRGADGKVVLDFGCGPGHDLVGFSVESRPQSLIGADVSAPSLREASRRLELHDSNASLVCLDPNDGVLPFADDSIDLIHCSGVLHHVPDVAQVLLEFRRILAKDGEARIMVYNYDSLWLHLYVAFVKQIEEQLHADESVRDAFRRLTDGPDCPISNAYTNEEFLSIASSAGFEGEHLGNAISVVEMSLLPRRFDAIADRQLPREHREFLSALTFNEKGFPMFKGHVAGIDACFRLSRTDK